jgi:hypothetical protein
VLWIFTEIGRRIQLSLSVVIVVVVDVVACVVVVVVVVVLVVVTLLRSCRGILVGIRPML